MPDENGDQTVSGGVITGGSFYGKVDNRDRSDFRPMYLGILAGGTFYAGNPGTVANGCCTVTYDYGKADGTYATQIVQKGEAADVIIYPTGGGTGGKSSPTTFDAGIGVCAVTAFTSLTGLALLRRKRRDEE